jgi:hypothetical protein
MSRTFARVFAPVLLVCSGGVAANAEVAYSNYTAGLGYNSAPAAGWVITGPGAAVPVPFSMANQFTSAASGILDTVTVSLGHESGGTNWVVSLYNDDGTNDPGTAITSWGFPYSMPNSAGGGSITLVNTTPSIMLSAGTKYWVAVAADWSTSPTLYGAWKWNSKGDGAPILEGPHKFSSDNGMTWSSAIVMPRGVFQVTVAAIPEPGAVVLLAIGIAMLAAGCRRHL